MLPPKTKSLNAKSRHPELVSGSHANKERCLPHEIPDQARDDGGGTSKPIYRPLTRAQGRAGLSQRRGEELGCSFSSPLGEAQIFLKIWVRGQYSRPKQITQCQIPSSRTLAGIFDTTYPLRFACAQHLPRERGRNSFLVLTNL